MTSSPSRLDQMGALLTAAIAVIIAGDSGLEKKRKKRPRATRRIVLHTEMRHFGIAWLQKAGVCTLKEAKEAASGFTDDPRVRAALRVLQIAIRFGFPNGGSDKWLMEALGCFVGKRPYDPNDPETLRKEAAWKEACAAARAETARVRAEEARARELRFDEDLVLWFASLPTAGKTGRRLKELITTGRFVDPRQGLPAIDEGAIYAAAQRLADRGEIVFAKGNVSLPANAEVAE